MSSVDNTTGCRNEADDEREKKGNSGGSIEVADLMTSPQGALEIEIKPLSEEDVSVRTINLQSS